MADNTNEYGNKLLNGEGLLHLVGTIKTEIASGSSGGGATYTAGDGIEIDANGVISRKPVLWSEPFLSLLNSGLAGFSIGGGHSTSANSLNAVVASLKATGMVQTASAFGYTTITPAQLNEALGTSYVVKKYSINLTASTPVSVSSYPASSTSNVNTGGRQSLGIVIVGNEIWCANNGLGTFKQMIGYNLSMAITPSLYNATNFGNTARLSNILTSLDNAINTKAEFPALTNNAGKVLAVNSGATGVEWVSQSGGGGASLPTDPANDGTYFLTTTVSSGTATQAWTSIPNANGNNF